MSTEGGQNTFVIHDDTYAETLSIPSGTSGAYTILQAANDGGAVVTGTLSVTNNYIQVEGLKFTGANQKTITGNHVKFLRTAFSGGPPTGNSSSVVINATSYVLLEDCWVYGGGGRYKVLVFECDYIILRRVIARHDGGWTCDGSNPEGGIQIYNTANSSVQNCIVIDANNSSCALGNFSTTRHNNPPYTKLNTNNEWLGCMVINGDGLSNGFIGDLDASGTQTITDFVSIDQSWGLTTGSDPGAFTFNRASFKSGTGGMGDFGSATVTATNIIIEDFSSDDFSGVSPTYFDTWNNGDTQSGTGRQTYDPESNGWLYPPRIEAASNLKSDGSSGGQIGAEITTKIGTSGTLYGDSGYNSDTEEALWPWPNEDRIKTDMEAVSTRGFCTTGNQLDGETEVTLTSYIFEYLGNQMPGDIYAAGDTTDPTVTISDSDPKNVASSSTTLTGTASDANGIDECKWRLGSAPDESNGTSCTGTTSWSCDVTGLSEGNNSVHVGCADPSNNWGSDSITANYTIPYTAGVTISGIQGLSGGVTH
jgi:hypothetical protein